MNAQEQATAVRRAAGVFALGSRGVVRVAGDDRRRWLNGMLSNDVSALEPGPDNSGCYAVQLTRQGRIVADFHVLERGDCFWLETAAASIEDAMAGLDRLLIADDVVLEDISSEWIHLGLEGPASRAILERASGAAVALAPDCGGELEIGGVHVVVAAFGFSGETAYRLFVPAMHPGGAVDSGGAAEPAETAEVVVRALHEAGEACGGLIVANDEAFEILRIEAGTPLMGSELAADTLPDEARLERAISTTKGCYTGQEVVARLRSHGGVKHRLVGLRGAALPEAGAVIARAGADRRTGELTSRCSSPVSGEIALGFVHRDDAEPGTRLEADGIAVEVAELPFVSPGSGGAASPPASRRGR